MGWYYPCCTEDGAEAQQGEVWGPGHRARERRGRTPAMSGFHKLPGLSAELPSFPCPQNKLQLGRLGPNSAWHRCMLGSPISKEKLDRGAGGWGGGAICQTSVCPSHPSPQLCGKCQPSLVWGWLSWRLKLLLFILPFSVHLPTCHWLRCDSQTRFCPPPPLNSSHRLG